MYAAAFQHIYQLEKLVLVRRYRAVARFSDVQRQLCREKLSAEQVPHPGLSIPLFTTKNTKDTKKTKFSLCPLCSLW